MNKIKKMIVVLRRRILFFFLWPLCFEIFKRTPVNEKLILFAYNKNYSEMPDNMVGLYDYFKKNGYDCRVMNSPRSGMKRLFFNFKFEKYYAKSKCVFLTDNFDPVYAHKPREGSLVVQLWHACGAFKKWGYSTLDLAWGGDRKTMLRFPMHNTYTDVFVSSNAVAPNYAEAFGCNEEIIKPLGTPRTDIFFDESFVSSAREKLLNLFPEIGKRKIILYAPTFRGNNPDESYNENRLDFEKLSFALSDEYVLVLKLHPFTAKKFDLTKEEKEKYSSFVFNASNLIGTDAALCAADILIADYSSLIFEFSLLQKPMLFFAYDLEEYDRDRSFYYDYKSFIPGKLVTDTDEIVSAIKRKDFESEKILPFKEKFMSACDGESTKRIAEYVIKKFG
ncbi:MAG: CDP-glycerol glycerophosphotransferase family protein [Clostridia bacterium]|nr:CDP-glycerol glycerophosphotransferase family protein [Clostridia bacterium]